MFLAGAHGVRQTFSYGTPQIQLDLAKRIWTATEPMGIEPDIIADLEGGGYRLGNFINADGEHPAMTVSKDEVLKCVCKKEWSLKEGKALPIADEQLFTELQVGDILIVGDGSAELEVIALSPDVQVRNRFDATIESRRGLWRQSAQNIIEPICLTLKDIEDLKHIAQHHEYSSVALSFVSSADDIIQVRKIMEEAGTVKKVIAKIETKKAIENIKSICEEADEIMVARGDLELAVSWKHLPGVVNLVVAQAVSAGKPFIMATQVAEGMMHGNYLTRAESCDLWHWKQEGMSGVLLSRETCWGERPVLTVERVRGILDVK